MSPKFRDLPDPQAVLNCPPRRYLPPSDACARIPCAALYAHARFWLVGLTWQRHMDHIAPLIQTALWTGLIAGIVWRFHLAIHGLLTALQKRVETGSTLKAGPFELIDRLHPLKPDKHIE